MMQYCVLAGKLSVTLCYSQASGGLLLNQKQIATEFDSLGVINESEFQNVFALNDKYT